MEITKIINNADKEMGEMLQSVCDYNSGFAVNKEQDEMLEKILEAMSVINRKYFYHGENIYADSSMPIGEGQTISQPSTVARMLMLAELEEKSSVLEVGTGSGWNAALIAYIIYPGSVLSIERIDRLKESAARNIGSFRSHLRKENYEAWKRTSNISLLSENIFERKEAWKNKYDKIIITAGIRIGEENNIESIAGSLLNENGILICPYEGGPLIVFRKNGKIKRFFTAEGYNFVPLIDKPDNI